MQTRYQRDSLRSPMSSSSPNSTSRRNLSFSVLNEVDHRNTRRPLYEESSNHERETNMLDIDNIDHEAIQNDAELRGLSQNKSAFNDNEYDYFDDVEELVHNSDEEDKYFHHLSQSDTPLLSYSNSSEIKEITRNRNNNINLDIKNKNNDNRSSYNINNSSRNNDNNNSQEISTLKETGKYALYEILRALVFLFFMVYWIIKEPIIRTVTLFTMIVSTLIVDPILFIWSALPNNKNWMPSPNLRKKITTWCTLIVFLFLCIPLYKHTKPYMPASVNDLSFKLNRPEQSNTDMVQAINLLRKENVKLWTEMEKTQEQLEQHEIILHKHDSILNGIEDTVRDAIEKDLPEQIFVKSGKNGQLELSPAFMTTFQSSLFWNNFLKQNNIQVKSMISQHVDEYLQRQQKDGAIVNKHTFMKLLSSTLMPYHDNNEDAELNFQSLIDSALVKYHQDVLNKADFALASRGASSLVTLTSSTWVPLPVWTQGLLRFVGLPSFFSSPEMALTPDNHVGECWHMYGDTGTLGISLSEKILVKGIAIEYPSKEVIMDMSSAPKNVQVFGIENFYKKTERWILLGEFKYDINKDEPIQLFDTIDLPTAFKVIVVKIRSNWGNQDYTDLYRVRVHGEPSS